MNDGAQDVAHSLNCRAFRDDQSLALIHAINHTGWCTGAADRFPMRRLWTNLRGSTIIALARDEPLLYKVLMMLKKYSIATTELLLIFPAVLFMTALFVRNLQPLQYEPAHTAQQIVDWYAMRPRVGLWVLLIALPLAVLITGCTTLLRRWSREAELRQAAQHTFATLRAHLATVLVAGATLVSGTVLAIVALHLLTD
jgi:hypothetical protein